MSRKIRVTSELIKKAKEVFKRAEGKAIVANKGLSRNELRALERAGKVRKMTTFGERKWADNTGTQGYAWSWTGDD